jgi:hypothetical protein
MTSTIKRLSAYAQYTVYRYPSAQSFTDGKRDAQTPTELTIYAMIQPASGRDLLRLPEGLRSGEVIAIWTETELRLENEAEQLRPDEVGYKGQSYQVESIENWSDAGNYYKALARRI